MAAMTTPLLRVWADVSKPIIGMLHLPPLPGAPRFEGDLAALTTRVLRDAETLVAGGVHGLMLENFGDAPFYPACVPPHVVAHMTRVAREVRQRLDVPLGINVLRNDGCSALAVAQAVGAAYVRVNVLCGARVADQGIIQGIAHELSRKRVLLGAGDIAIFADVDVKHSSSLGPPRPISEEVTDLLERGGADAIIVTGGATGQAAELTKVGEVKAAAGETPVLVGSGVTAETVRDFLSVADGVIVGTALKAGGVVTNPVDPARVSALLDALA